MKIDIPQIKQVINLNEYAPEFGEAVIEVWVNPPRRILTVMDELSSRNLSEDDYHKAAEIIGELWGCPAEDVTRLIKHSQDTDPKLFEWLIYKTFVMIRDHRTQIKKN